MRVPNQSELTKYSGLKFTYLFYHLDDNAIGDDGCEYLSNSNWTNIQPLNLSGYFTIEGVIKLAMLGVNT